MKIQRGVILELNDIIKELKEKGYLLVEYVDVNYIVIKNKNGSKLKTTLKKIKENKTFNFISRENPYTIENIKMYMSKFNPTSKLISTVYTANNKKLEWECGNIFSTHVQDFVYGSKKICDECSKAISSFEMKTQNWLKENNINFIREYSFEGFKNKNNKYCYYFDFYLPDYNICIECDGQQHYSPVNFEGVSQEEAEINFQKTIDNDRIKDEYCFDNNINLLRIPYWEFNSENYKDILKNYLKNNT